MFNLWGKKEIDPVIDEVIVDKGNPEIIEKKTLCCGSRQYIVKGKGKDNPPPPPTESKEELKETNPPIYSEVSDDSLGIFNEPKKITSIEDLTKYIIIRKRKLEESKRILDLKYASNKRCYDIWNVSTILLSTGLTLIESCKLIFLSDEDGQPDTLTKDFFNLAPIIIASVITCSTGILKFMKYQEYMEETYIVIDKCINMISKLKNKREQIKLMDEKQFTDIKDEYFKYISPDYSEVYQETVRYIEQYDYKKYLNSINIIEYHKHKLFHEKQVFFQRYKKDKANKIAIDDIDTNISCYNKNLCCC